MPKIEFRKEIRSAQFASGLPNAATTALPTDWGHKEEDTGVVRESR
jgi:hypothetical protein